MTTKLFVLSDGTELSPEEMTQHLTKRVLDLETKVQAQACTIENLLSIVNNLQTNG